MILECSIDDCTRAVKSRGWCVAHYLRWRRYGDPLWTPGSKVTSTSTLPLAPCRICGREKRRGGHRFWCDSCAESRLLLEKDEEYVQRMEHDKALRRSYGITVDDYERMLLEQGGVCAICHGPKTKSFRVFDVDHDKLTGLVRGLLCRRCNTGLGYIEAGFHEPALQYLRGAEPSS